MEKYQMMIDYAYAHRDFAMQNAMRKVAMIQQTMTMQQLGQGGDVAPSAPVSNVRGAPVKDNLVTDMPLNPAEAKTMT